MRRSSLLFVTIPLAAATCHKGESGGEPPPTVTSASTRGAPAPPTGDGMELRLSEGSAEQGEASDSPLAAATALPRAALDALLARLPALTTAPRRDFAVRPRSTPPPVAGATVNVPFPPPPASGPPDAPAGPPTVLRWSPDGAVPLAGQVSVTFDQPMVALTSQTAAAATVPVTLAPQPPGAWRWVGTRTLLFEPTAGRMPMATDYTVKVAAGTASAVGTKVASAFEGRFSTPPVRVLSWTPSGGPTVLQPVIAFSTDQAVDDEAIRGVLTVKAGGKSVAVRLATALEIDADPSARTLARDTAAERFVAVVPSEPLPTATAVEVVLPTGTPSAEGPVRTKGDQSTSFRTFGPFKFDQARCGWDGTCRPGWPLWVRFTNPIDPDVDLAEVVAIEPALPGATLAVEGSAVAVYGATRANTVYSVTVRAGLRDEFGQALAEPVQTSFSVGAAEPAWPNVYASSDPQVPDPFAPPTATFVIQGMSKVRVRIARVTPDDWLSYVDPKRRDYREPPPTPGTVVVDELRTVAGDPNQPQLFQVPLAEQATGGFGQFVVEVASPAGTAQDRRQFARTWVNATQLGLAVHTDAHDAIVHVTELRTGKAIAGAAVTLGEARGTTDAHGLARLPATTQNNPAPLLVVKHGEDAAFLSANGAAGRWGQWSPDRRGIEAVWSVFDDRHLYRPSETVHVKGWVRRVDFDRGGDLLPPKAEDATVSWTLYDAVGNELKRGSTARDALGGFAFDLALPDTPNLGATRIELSDGLSSTSHGFEIREFRRPEFEVSAQVEDAGPHVIGGAATAAVTAKYYAGGVLPNADVAWEVHATPASFRPAGWDDAWRFGQWEPVWWRPWWLPTDRGQRGETYSFAGKTDSSGTHRLRMDFLGVRPARPMTVNAQATVMDVNRQAWTSATSVLVHPASVYVGLRTDKTFVESGEKLPVDVAAVGLDGEAVSGVVIDVALVHERWTWKRGSWVSEEDARLTCQVTSASTPAACSFTPDRGGSWKLVATARDAEGHATETSSTVWVTGDATWPTVDRVEQQQVTLVPDKDTYAPGDTARVLVQVPFAPSELVITHRREGISFTDTRTLTTTSTTLEVPIRDGDTPNLYLQVDATGAAKRAAGDTPRPAYASGQLDLPVPPLHRALSVQVLPAADGVDPGSKTSVTVVVTDAKGRPVPSAQVVVAMVDESVLALSGYQIPDPLGVFHPHRDPGTMDHQQRAWVLLADLASLPGGAAAGSGGIAEEGMVLQSAVGGEVGGRSRNEFSRKASAAPMAPAMEAMSMDAMPAPAPPATSGEPAAPIALRTDFRADALWVPAVSTDAQGRATVPVSIPDNLTRYRVTAVAVDGTNQFGKGDADVTARLPLMVRPSAPRFLNFGDTAELPVVVQNQTDKALVVDVGARADNATIDGADRGGRRVTVPANDRVEVRLPIATLDAGRAHFQVAAASGSAADSAAFDFPVWTPATSEAFAVYGTLDGDKGTKVLKQPVALPTDVWSQFGGLEVTTSSTALQSLTDAFIYLVEYPYGCAEQIGSRVLSIAALADVLAAFDAEGLPDEAALKRAVAADLEELKKRQNHDGSWGWWVRESKGEAFVTLHVAHALVRAKDAGFAVDDQMLRAALQRVRNIDGLFDRWWSDEGKRVARAYAVRVRQLGGEQPVAEARAILAQAGGVDKLPLEALGWILPTLHAAGGPEVADIVRHLNNRVTETAGTAQWVVSYEEADDALLLHGDRRTDGILLEALLETQPTNDVLPKVVTGLLDGRKKGRWGNTQDNAWVLLALRRYFHVAEGVTPDFVARVWLGDAYAGDHTFKGRTTERARIDVPMSWLTEAGGNDDLTVAREGAGRMYYRLGLSYAPKSLKLDPMEAGFSVTRSYEGVDDPTDVSRAADGTWQVKAGARVRVTVSMAVPSRRYHVALVDPLPAGFEVLDPALKVTGDVPVEPPAEDDGGAWKRGWWWGPWYEHQNLRDERVESFATNVWEGVHVVRYVARATTPGSFVVPPAKAEEMYHPETFGRTGTDRVVVK